MSVEYPAQPDASAQERRERCQKLNEWFRQGRAIYEPEVLAEIRKTPFPILVDFNNVLANNRSPIRINPAAETLMQSLIHMGDVFVVTTATGWETVAGHLRKIDPALLDSVVLLVEKNFSFENADLLIRDDASDLSRALDAYLALIDREKLHQQARIQTQEQVAAYFTEPDEEGVREDRRFHLLGAPAHKNVAPYFLKTWNIPNIDDFSVVGVGQTHLWVYPWPPEENPAAQEQKDRLTFDQAVANIKQIKETLSKNNALPLGQG